jgi:hemerythrin superfamily protein
VTQGAQTIFEVLSSDHRAVEELIAQALAEPGEDAALDERLVMELVRHFVAEEQYLYPALRSELPDGTQLSDAGFEANRESEQTLRALEGRPLDGTALRDALHELAGQFTRHVRDQETDIFPRLAGRLTAEEQNRLGNEVLGAEQLAPTRPRSVAVESAPLNKLSSFVEGFIDRVRDSYTNRGVR